MSGPRKPEALQQREEPRIHHALADRTPLGLCRRWPGVRFHVKSFTITAPTRSFTSAKFVGQDRPASTVAWPMSKCTPSCRGSMFSSERVEVPDGRADVAVAGVVLHQAGDADLRVERGQVLELGSESRRAASESTRPRDTGSARAVEADARPRGGAQDTLRQRVGAA